MLWQLMLECAAFVEKMLNLDEAKQYKIVTVGEGGRWDCRPPSRRGADLSVASRGAPGVQQSAAHGLHGKLDSSMSRQGGCRLMRSSGTSLCERWPPQLWSTQANNICT